MSSSVKRRLWLICEPYYPETNATGHYITQVGTGLADEFDVNVICGQPNYLSKGIRAPAQDSYRNVRIFRVWSTTLSKDILVFQLINILTIGTSMFLKSLRLFKRGDRVLVVTAPPSLPYTTALAALIKGASYVVLLHDLYPDILVAVGKTKKGSFFYNAIEWLNRWLYKHANRLIVTGRDMQERVFQKAIGLDVRIVTIPNWSDLHAITPSPKKANSLLERLGISNKFVLMYAGNIGHPTDIETIVEAADFVRGDPSIHFVFVRAGAKKAWLEREADRRGLSNISVLGQLPREEQNIFLNACDVGLVSLIPGMLGTAMPSRTYNIMAAGKPIIALTEPGSELARVIDEESIGWSTLPRDAEGFVAILHAAKANPRVLLEMGQRARSVAEEKYSPEIAIESYGELFR